MAKIKGKLTKLSDVDHKKSKHKPDKKKNEKNHKKDNKR